MPGGGLKLPAYPTRVGVFPYRLADGSVRRELRPPEEVFHPDSLRTLAGAPLTMGHPSIPVTPDTWKAVSVGHVGHSVAPEGKFVASDVVVQDGETIRTLDSWDGADLSCGYTADLEATSGNWQGEEFDAIQRNIRYNHVGIGPKGWGRAGPDVGLRLDAQDAYQVGDQDMTTPNTNATQKITMIRIDGRDYEVGSQDHLAKLDADRKTVEAERDAAQGRADALDKELAKVREDLKAALDPKAVAARAKVRADLLDQGRRIMGKKFSADKAAGQSDVEMMVDMIKMVDATFDPEGKSEDYIRGAFAAVVRPALAKMAGTQETPAEEAGDTTPETPAEEASDAKAPAPGAPPVPGQEEPKPNPLDSAYSRRSDGKAPIVNAEQVRQKMIQDSREAWKRPLGPTAKG